MSPTAIFTDGADMLGHDASSRAGGGVPGVVELGGCREGVLPGYYPGTLPVPIFNIF